VRAKRTALVLILLTLSPGCGSDAPRPAPAAEDIDPQVALDEGLIPTPIGRGPDFVPPARAPASGCVKGVLQGRFRAHLELFGRRHAVVIPAAIGLGPPLRHSHSARITGAACRADARTLEPVGVIDFDRTDLTLGDLFEIWGEPLGPRRMAAFRGPVSAFVAGERVRGDPAKIRLREGAQIVLQVGGYIPPHRSFLFPPRSEVP
jgi:hypothetical protein